MNNNLRIMRDIVLEALHKCNVIGEFLRVFPYGRYLITLIPLYALLIDAGVGFSLRALIYLAPFVLVMSAGFGYNTLSDVSKDPKFKNVIKRGDLSPQSARQLIGLLLMLSIITCLIVFRSYVAIFAFIIYSLLWFLYSGLRVRFKETLLGPMVASVVLFAGPPVIFMIEFKLFTQTVLWYVLGVFLVYTAHEVGHTIGDYYDDLRYKAKTFAVRVGGINHSLVAFILSAILGCASLIISITSISQDYLTIGLLTFLTIIGLGLDVINIKYKTITLHTFRMIALLTIYQVGMILNFPYIIIFMISWIYLIRYP